MFNKLTGRIPGLMDDGQYKKFAVLAPFLPDESAFLFEVRSAKLHRQPGEICLPGGFIEPGETPKDAAVRETCEELLISREQLELVAPLDILVTPFHTVISPFLARLSGYEGAFNPDEVAEIFTVPADYFIKTEPMVYYNDVSIGPGAEPFPYELLGIESYPWSKSRYPVLFYTYQNRVIWGLTAKIMHHIALLCRGADD